MKWQIIPLTIPDDESFSDGSGESAGGYKPGSFRCLRHLAGADAAMRWSENGRGHEHCRSHFHALRILWSVDTLDWKTRNAASSVQTVLNQVKDGSVVLMHELYNASGDAAVTIIPALVERGYQLVTVSELAQFRGGLAGGTVYYSFHK